jgi:transcriptional regulator with XRE-family HTH domain
MTETGWQAIGRIAKARRERLQLKQEDLAAYGGPKVATVGKFERAAQERFPLRTQQQMERALGWSRGVIDEFVSAIDAGDLSPSLVKDWEHDLIDEDLPDLTPVPALSNPSFLKIDDDELLVRVTRGFEAIMASISPPRRDAAFKAAVVAMTPFLMEDWDLMHPDEPRLSVAPDTTESSVAAHDLEVPIERRQEHDEHP